MTALPERNNGPVGADRPAHQNKKEVSVIEPGFGPSFPGRLAKHAGGSGGGGRTLVRSAPWGCGPKVRKRKVAKQTTRRPAAGSKEILFVAQIKWRLLN